MPTWDELVELEPGLALLEHEILKVQDWPERPHFCKGAYWYGERGGKIELVRLVGSWRRGVDLATDLHEGGEGPIFMSADEFILRGEGYGRIHAQIREQEEQAGHGVLWTSEAYDVAYEHLYGILPDCRHEGSCWTRPP